MEPRIGIATGVVVVGDLIGEGEAQERGIVGETPSLAMRLQALAEPNAIVIADSTRDQIGALFTIEDLGPQVRRGVAALQRAWRILAKAFDRTRDSCLAAGSWYDGSSGVERQDADVRRESPIDHSTGCSTDWRRCLVRPRASLASRRRSRDAAVGRVGTRRFAGWAARRMRSISL